MSGEISNGELSDFKSWSQRLTLVGVAAVVTEVVVVVVLVVEVTVTVDGVTVIVGVTMEVTWTGAVMVVA